MNPNDDRIRLLLGLEAGYRTVIERVLADQQTRYLPCDEANRTVATWCEILRTLKDLGAMGPSRRDDDGGRGPDEGFDPRGGPGGIAEQRPRALRRPDESERAPSERPRARLEDFTQPGLED